MEGDETSTGNRNTAILEGARMKHSQVSLIVGLALAVFSTVPACAVELQVIAGGGIAAPLNEIAANFESISGHKVTIRYGTAPQLIKMASSGEVFDIAVVPQDVVKEASARD